MTMDLMTAPASLDMTPGFVDAARDSQIVFRAVMDALSRPGEVRQLRLSLAPPPPLDQAMAAIALTLLDFETAFWLPDAAADAINWTRFHTGARRAARPADAEFVLVPAGAAVPSLDALALGTDEEPHRSATLVLGVRGFAGGTRHRLSGPGIRESLCIDIDGLEARVVEGRAALAPLFPRGLDIVLTAGPSLAALPRTTRLEV
jgi:alpha-D-ribose 1-methylphosphonate 5-triphosphate synthase subunit PhnH